MKYSLGISNLLEEISSLSHSIVFLYFFVLITEEGFLISPCYSCYTREDSTYGHHRNQTDYILCSQRWRSSIQSAKTRPGVDGGSDHELLIVKFRLKLKKAGKTARPFRYDLNKILYDYTVEVRNRFKGLDLIDRVPHELWIEVRDIVQETGSRPSPWKRNAKKQNGCLGRPYK